MRKLLLFSFMAPLLFIHANSTEAQGQKSLHHDRYTGILYSDEAGSCIPGGGGGGTGGGGPTEPPIPPVPPKSFQSEQKIGIIAFNRGKTWKKISFHVRAKGIEGIIGVDIHCRDIAGNDSGVGVTLKRSKWFDHGWKDGAGYFKAPDEENNCGWLSLQDVHSAIDNGEAFVRMKTENNPDGELSGDIHCIGFEESDWL
ncbi:MAG: hypothetical protein DRQ88_03915 [Epsilonproteobacteria bacterium]|nr:MAG: hypothetical protein DRQ89_04220 [Campylobacterota bacterium]RLA67183.1 MAG: hypothetical protein DRQ88_03915 [Campylobacterota bacterium]